MLNWLSEYRASIAAVVILLLLASFVFSIFIGRNETKAREKDEVFGDPVRTLGGWYWSLCGISALLLVWFYFSWGVGRAYFPNAANELCQVAKVQEALSPINATLPASSRYYKSTTLVGRNGDQLNELQLLIPASAYTDAETAEINSLFVEVRKLLAINSDPNNQSAESRDKLNTVAAELDALGVELRAGYDGLEPTAEAKAQPRWGVTHIEIPLLPQTSRGVLFDQVSVKAASVSKTYLKIRNNPPAATAVIENIRGRIDALKAANKAGSFDEKTAKARNDFMKSFDRIFKRLDDGNIFPAAALDGITTSMDNLNDAVGDAKGSLGIVDALFIPGQGVVKSRTQCTEQGSGRWLPKPTDVVATLGKLANPNVDEGGGFKGTTLLWWKWLPVADVVGFFTPDFIADLWPGEYARHAADGTVTPNTKDKVLAFAQGKVSMGHIPMLDGHIWDSLFRVLVALALGVLLGVPLGIYMGVSRFFKSFFDPLIELYRPVPPLAWAPLILTIFGIQDDGKIFLLFMVAFAIMVISARTGSSGTQLTKIRASHSLGASTKQIVRHVILPNAMPEILTGIRIAIGVCWGTLVAAEMLAGTTGVGFIENVARTVSDYELIWVTILIMGLLGLMFDLMMRWAIAKIIPWRGKG
ncbi:MAG: ABC transporter permease [Alphaproteobacteria bacterium]